MDGMRGPNSMMHRPEVMASRVCGCFYCLATFAPAEILEWIDRDESGVGQTAICPRCGIDAVIADSSARPISPELLKRMHDAAFE